MMDQELGVCAVCYVVPGCLKYTVGCLSVVLPVGIVWYLRAPGAPQLVAMCIVHQLRNHAEGLPDR
jgi:hypothetical protein